MTAWQCAVMKNSGGDCDVCVVCHSLHFGILALSLVSLSSLSVEWTA